ncbi:MAG: peptidylprolyl isomerase [Planctomycetota bacterium]
MSRQFLRNLCRKINKLRTGQMKRLRKRNPERNLDFAPLERRQLLAVIDVPLTAGTNMVVNGGFEDVDSTVTTNFYDEVRGWSTPRGIPVVPINILELANDRQHVLDLDSTPDVADRVFQDIATEEGESYILAVDFRERPVDENAAAVTNTFEIYWNELLVGTYQGTEQWQTATIVVEGTADLTRLEFREVGESGNPGGDGRGALIDNVRVVSVSEMAIANGDFQTIPGDGGAGFYHTREFTAWGAMGTDVINRLIQIDDDGTGNYSLNLDTTASQVDRIWQDITTTSGAQYFLRFDLTSAGPNADLNELRIRFGNQWVGTFFGQSDTRSFGVLVEADSDLSRLVFREVDGVGNNGYGPIIDNVQMFQVSAVTGDLVIDLDPTSTGNDATALFVENLGEADLLSNGVSISHASGAGLTSATVTITNRADGNNEILAVDVTGSGMITSFDDTAGVLTISAPVDVRDFTVADFEAILATLTYDNVAAQVTGGNRTITVTVTDSSITEGSNTSDPATIDVEVDIDNNIPTIFQIQDQEIDFGEALEITVTARDSDAGSSLTYSLKLSGDAVTGTDNVPVISEDGVITWTPSTSGEADITVVVTDDRGESAEETFKVSVADFAPFQGNRALTNVTPEDRDGIYGDSFNGDGPPMTIDSSRAYTATISTEVGDIVVNLFADRTPLSVNNFVNLAEDGFYDGLGFHRVVETQARDENGNLVFDGDGNPVFERFVAQAGDPTGTSSGGPGYRINDEILSDLLFDGPGVLAWAKTSLPNTNGSQFFITYDATQFQNDENFTIFGEVTSGLANLDLLNLRDPNDAVPASATIINSITIDVV